MVGANLNLNRNRQNTSVVYYVDASGWGLI